MAAVSYLDAYHAWKDKQVCIGCGRKSCTMEPGEEKWITEYLCTPCWEDGVRGKPQTMFDGYSGTVIDTDWPKSPVPGKPHIVRWKGNWIVVARNLESTRTGNAFRLATEHARALRNMWMFVDNRPPQLMEWTEKRDPMIWA